MGGECHGCWRWQRPPARLEAVGEGPADTGRSPRTKDIEGPKVGLEFRHQSRRHSWRYKRMARLRSGQMSYARYRVCPPGTIGTATRLSVARPFRQRKRLPSLVPVY